MNGMFRWLYIMWGFYYACIVISLIIFIITSISTFVWLECALFAGMLFCAVKIVQCIRRDRRERKERASALALQTVVAHKRAEIAQHLFEKNGR